MEQRFLLLYGKDLIELVEKLTALNFGRIVYVEKTEESYAVIIDTYALAVIDIQAEQYAEDRRREENREILMKLPLNDANTL